jgi:hypothetical protein
MGQGHRGRERECMGLPMSNLWSGRQCCQQAEISVTKQIDL